MKLYTVITINRRTGEESPPRINLAPMTHAAARRFIKLSRTAYTDYRLHPWPDDVPHGEPPLIMKSPRK